MRLTKIAILAIRGSDVEVKERLALALGVTLPSAYRIISENKDDLTKAAAMEIIREVTGLTDEEILEKGTEIISERK